MDRLDFGRPAIAPVPHHLHDDGDADTVEGIQQGILTKPKVEVEPAKLGWLIH